jgi:hypothetical protein
VHPLDVEAGGLTLHFEKKETLDEKIDLFIGGLLTWNEFCDEGQLAFGVVCNGRGCCT